MHDADAHANDNAHVVDWDVVKRWLAFVLTCSACGGGGGLPTGASPVMANVEFHYHAVVVRNAERARDVGCDGVVRIYPSWWGFTHATMLQTDDGGWAALFENVPVGRQSVRLTTPPGCGNPVLAANEVELEAANDNLVFAFMVHPDGSVTY